MKKPYLNFILLMVSFCIGNWTSAGEPQTFAPGRHLFMAISGTSLGPETAAILKEVKPAGVILLGNNVQSMKQVKRLVLEIKKTCGEGLGSADFPLIAVDQEGGRINRLRLANAPSARVLGQSNTTDSAKEVGRYYAEACRQLGIAIVLAPVLDVYDPSATSIIGDRSFGTDPEQVSRFGVAFAEGVLAGGALPVVKHFPGHGATQQDSHKTLAVLAKNGEELERQLKPFLEAVRHDLPAIMIGHISVPALDHSGGPATLSSALIQGLLRTQWGYGGYVLTDDMRMAAINQPAPQAVVAALHAGNDGVIYTGTGPSVIRAICVAISAAAAADPTFLAQLTESQYKLEHFRQLLLQRLESSETTSREKALAVASVEPLLQLTDADSVGPGLTVDSASADVVKDIGMAAKAQRKTREEPLDVGSHKSLEVALTKKQRENVSAPSPKAMIRLHTTKTGRVGQPVKLGVEVTVLGKNTLPGDLLVSVMRQNSRIQVQRGKVLKKGDSWTSSFGVSREKREATFPSALWSENWPAGSTQARWCTLTFTEVGRIELQTYLYLNDEEAPLAAMGTLEIR